MENLLITKLRENMGTLLHNRFLKLLLLIVIASMAVSCARRRSEYRPSYDTYQPHEQTTILIPEPSSVIQDETENPNATKPEQELYKNLEIPSSNIQPSQILKRIAYTTSYNKNTKCPNWVAWHLKSENLDGPYHRSGVPYYDDNGSAIGIANFSPEIVYGDYFVDMEANAPRQEHSDWREHPSNIDHGHMCPAADCKWSKEVINQSFLLTNMCPQDHDLNAGDWENLEEKCRTWAKRYGDIYIVAGPIFLKGVRNTLGANRVGIPDAFFKVILCMQKAPKAIGFVYPNNSEHHPQSYYALSVDEVEKHTGIDFFPSLPDDIETDVESTYSLNDW